MTYQDVYLMENLTIEAKAIYGMLCSYAGTGVEAFPSVDFMCDKLKISNTRFYKHMNLLIGAGVVIKKQTKNERGGFANNTYILAPNLQNLYPQNGGIENLHQRNEGMENEGDNNNNNYNNNNYNNNNYNNKKSSRFTQPIDRQMSDSWHTEVRLGKDSIGKVNINYQLIADMYNNTCVSFLRLTKLSNKRKKAIKARLNTYTVEDFQRLFEMAESSSFLKGKNNRNWSATFDWLICDGNMAKVLDGNYSDGSSAKETPEPVKLPDYYQLLGHAEPSPDDPFQ